MDGRNRGATLFSRDFFFLLDFLFCQVWVVCLCTCVTKSINFCAFFVVSISQFRVIGDQVVCVCGESHMLSEIRTGFNAYVM